MSVESASGGGASPSGSAVGRCGGDSRRLLLTRGGRRYVEETFVRENEEANSVVEIERTCDSGSDASTPTWYVFYDTRTLSLARQGARLCERDGKWELKIRRPLVAPQLLVGEVRLHFYSEAASNEMLDDPEGILLRLGVDAVRSTGYYDVRDKLAELDVRPIARFSWEHRIYRADPFAVPNSCAIIGLESGDVIRIDLESVRFDTAHAEPAGVASLLGRIPQAEWADAMQATFADFQLLYTSCGSSCRNADATSAVSRVGKLDAFLRAHHLDPGSNSARSESRSSALAVYLRTCRPNHYRALLQAGVRLEPDDETGGTRSTLSNSTNLEEEERIAFLKEDVTTAHARFGPLATKVQETRARAGDAATVSEVAVIPSGKTACWCTNVSETNVPRNSPWWKALCAA